MLFLRLRLIKRFCFLIPASMVLLAVLPPPVHGLSLSAKRQLFKQVYDALEDGKTDSYIKNRRKLQNYPLYAYLVFAYLKNTLNERSAGELKNFIRRHGKSATASSHLAALLHTEWLRKLAEREDWPSLVKYYAPQRDITLKCQYTHALFQTGDIKKATAHARHLWMAGRIQPKACIQTFEQFEKSGKLDESLIMGRAILALQKRQLKLAEFLSRKLQSKSHKYWMEKWLYMHREPTAAFRDPVLSHDSETVREILMHGIHRLARKDLDLAYNTWQSIKGKYQYATAQLKQMEEYLAVNAVYSGSPKTQTWLEKLDGKDDTVLSWRLRTSLRQAQWEKALHWYTLLSQQARMEENWRYIYGRILQHLGREKNNRKYLELSQQIFTKLAASRGYYSFLASDRLGLPYRIKIKPENFSAHEIAKISKRRGVIRARELYLLDMYPHVRIEWRNALKGLKPVQYKYAAALASRWGWHDEAIFTYLKFQPARHSNVDLPFPVAYRKTVLENASKQQIDPAWIFGVIRQESVFRADVRSGAGAVGLMQLMPSTARMVARHTETELNGSHELTEPQVNIRLGSAYLRMLLDRHEGNPVLATSSYNAGRGRTSAWLPDQKLPADIWVETIPFNETRNYVANVMSFSVVFEYLLSGKTTPLQQRMPDVEPET